MGQFAVGVETDDGLTGYGAGGGGAAGVHVVETELRRIRVCPHRGSEVWALHAIASLDPDPLAESGRPWVDWVDGQPEIAVGSITVGNAPGFGVRLPVPGGQKC